MSAGIGDLIRPRLGACISVLIGPRLGASISVLSRRVLGHILLIAVVRAIAQVHTGHAASTVAGGDSNLNLWLSLWAGVVCDRKITISPSAALSKALLETTLLVVGLLVRLLLAATGVS